MENPEENVHHTDPNGLPKKEAGPSLKKPKSRIIKIIYWLSGIFLFLLIAIPLLLNFYADRIFGETVQQIIKKETGGKYDFSYGKIRFNLFMSDLVIYNLSVFPDTIRGKQDSLGVEGNQKFVELKIPELHFAGASIYNVLRKKELVINKFYIGQPGLKLYLPGNGREKNIAIDSLPNGDLNKRTLHLYLNDYLTLLKIIDFELNNGYLEIIRGNAESTTSIKISDISVLLSNFQVDSLSTQALDRLLLSDSLGISLKSGHFEFLGKSHNLTFNNIKISIDEQTIEIDGLVVKPDSSRYDSGDLAFVELRVPSVKLTDFDFQSFIDKKLFVGNIVIKEPDINFHPAKGESNVKFVREKLAKQIFETLSKLFYPIEIGEISINAASFRIDGFQNESLKDFYLPDFSIYLHKLEIDSASFMARSRQFFVDDLRLTLNNQEFFLKKSARYIRIGYLDLDSRSSQLELCDVLIEGYRKKPQSIEMNLQIPVLELQGKNFKQDFLENKFHVLSLDIQEPAITIHADADTSSRPEKIDALLLYHGISEFISELSVERCKINCANFSFGRFDGIFANQVFSPNVSLVLKNFLLNKNAHNNRDKIFYSSDIQINAENLAIVAPDSIHRVIFENLAINTKDSSVKILGMHADTLNLVSANPFFLKDKDRLKLDVDKIALKGIDFAGFYNHRFVEISNVEIDNPTGYFLDVLTDKSLENNEKIIMPDFQIAHLKLNNGKFYLQEVPAKSPRTIAFDGLTFSIDCLQPSLSTKVNKIEGQNIDLNSENVTINIPGNTYGIELSNLKLSSADSLISATNFIFQPQTYTAGSENVIVRAKVPAFTVNGISIGEFYEDNILRAGSIHLQKPSYRLIFTRQTADPKNLTFDGEELRNQILKAFRLVDVKHLDMTNAEVEVFGGTTFNSRELLFGDFDLKINSFFVDSATKMTKPNLFFSNDIRFSARKQITASVGENFEVSLGKLTGSTRDGFLKAENVIVNGNEADQKKQQGNGSDVEIEMKNLDMRGIDFYKLITRRKLKMERLKVDEPDLWLTRTLVPVSQRPKEKQEIDLFKVISKQLSEVQISNVDIADASLKIQDNGGINAETFLLTRIDAGLKNFLIDSANQVFGNKFLYSDNLHLKISDYNYLTPDSLYLIGAAGIRFSSKNMAVSIDSGYMVPQLDEENFAKRVGHQTDRFQWVFDSAQILNFRIPEFIYQDRVSVSNAIFYQFIGDDYRDKTYALLPDHYAPLPVSALRNLPLIFTLDTLILENSRIQYREYVPPAMEPGIIWFDGINLYVKNITNDSLVIARDPVMKFIAKGKLMNEAALAFSTNFDLRSTKDEFHASGVLNKLDITSMNPFLENVAFVRVKKGTNNLLTFNYDGNNDVARGELFFSYDNLAIRLIDKKTMEDKGFGESVASFFANNFIVRSDNPKYTILFRKGKIYFERNKQKSFFSFVAKSVLSGISTTIRGGNEERKERRRKRKLELQNRPAARLNEEEYLGWLLPADNPH